MKVVLATAAVLIAATFSSAAQADNYGGVSYATEQKMKEIIYAEFGHNWRGDTMVRCAERESGFNQRAWNRTDSHRDRAGNHVKGSFGLLQIGAGHHPLNMTVDQFRLAMWNPYANVRAAHTLMNGDGLGPWGGGC